MSIQLTCVLLGLVLVGAKLPDAGPSAGWVAQQQRKITPAGVFEYMDGAGELYLSYGFKSLLVRDYVKPGEPKVTCELYQMPTSADAYGVFSQDRTGGDLKIGQGAIYGSGLLIAWQGKYLVRVMADRETPGAKRCVVALAREIIKSCGPSGKLPEALSWLPSKGLAPKSVHFFHTHTCLNYFHFVSTENLLRLSAKTNAVMGSYSGTKGKSLALVIGYPKVADSRAAWERFRGVYMKGLKLNDKHSPARLENGKWLAGTCRGRKVFIVLESPTSKDCAALIERLDK